MEAMEIVPGLVQKETPLEAFLKVTQNETLAAARRVAKFWKLRKILFAERWLLPMTQTGAGALGDMEIQFVQTGLSFLIPRMNTGPIIVVDFSRAVDVFAKAKALQADTLMVMERVGMYLSVAFLDDFSRGPSVLLHPVTSKKRPELEIRDRFWDMLQTAFPGYLEQVIVAQSIEEGKKEMLDFIGKQTASVLQLSTHILPEKVNTDSVGKAIDRFGCFDIPRDLVPVYLGGQYDMDSQVAVWTRTRLSIESMLDAVSPAPMARGRDMKSIFKPKGHRHKSNLLLNRREGMSEEEHRRERNRLYVRRNQQKRQMELIAFEGQKQHLEAKNHKLKAINVQLEKALQTAMQLVLDNYGEHL